MPETDNKMTLNFCEFIKIRLLRICIIIIWQNFISVPQNNIFYDNENVRNFI